MADAELIKRWKMTRWHLERARHFLPSDVVENIGDIPDHDLSTLVAYQEYLISNELELALDELNGLGELNDCRGGFWPSLERAAEVMGLHSRVATLHRRFEESLDKAAGREDLI